MRNAGHLLDAPTLRIGTAHVLAPVLSGLRYRRCVLSMSIDLCMCVQCTADIESQQPQADSSLFFSTQTTTAPVDDVKCDGTAYCPHLTECYDQCATQGSVGVCWTESCCPSTTSGSYQLALYANQVQYAQWYLCTGATCFDTCNAQYTTQVTDEPTAAPTAVTTSSSTTAGYFNRVYRIETTTCQSGVIHTKCNHRQVRIMTAASLDAAYMLCVDLDIIALCSGRH